jgi:hypothetical protein
VAAQTDAVGTNGVLGLGAGGQANANATAAVTAGAEAVLMKSRGGLVVAFAGIMVVVWL